MKSTLKIAYIFIFSTSFACAQNLSSKLMLGEWVYSGDQNHQVMIECPDVLALYEKGLYEIFNDCYGDSASPIIEKGKWSVDEKGRKILFTERRFEIEFYNFHGSSEKLDGYVKNSAKNEITICFGERKSCVDENYKRIDSLK